jgi:hypothetical protein
MSQKPWHRKSFYWISGIIALLIVVRAILPGLVLKKLNTYLANFSPLYGLHIDDLDLQLFRMAYSFDRVSGKLKKNSFEFMTIEKVDVSLAWRELLRGRVVTDVELTRAKVDLTLDALHAVQGYGLDQSKTDAKNVKDATIPFDLERLRCKDSEIQFSDVAGLPPEDNFRLTHIEAMGNNLTPRQKDGISLYTAVGNIQETAKIKVIAQLRPNHKPLDWSVNAEVKDFELTKLNSIARRMVPLTFKSGSLTLFTATQSVNNELRGYFKPFLKDLVFVGDRGDFKNVGQFFIEILGTVGNFFLKNSDTHALATRINFHKKGNEKTEVDTGKALDYALKNGFGKALKPTFDETLELK